ncbi:MAG: type I restriction enzyme HsdR N-terminal domain-containing protein [Muribaculaceae bacterium]|nr:type I restriction enzyme HsdR N-terminal domain-containing protein [Muribaculaceae bacterium]
MELNLPAFDIKLRRRGAGVQVWDTLRRRWVALTPEEWVRQHFVNYLITQMGYPAGLLANEVSLRLNGTLRRCDSIVYSRGLRPLMVIEYKAPHVAVTREVFEQVARYNTVIKAPYLAVSNGMVSFCCRVDMETGKWNFLQEIPPYPQLEQE